MTYRVTRSSLGFLDFLLLTMKDKVLVHPPQRLEDSDKLSRTLVMAEFDSAASCLSVGRTLLGFMIFILMDVRSSGSFRRVDGNAEGDGNSVESQRDGPFAMGIGATWKAALAVEITRAQPPTSASDSQY